MSVCLRRGQGKGFCVFVYVPLVREAPEVCVEVCWCCREVCMEEEM